MWKYQMNKICQFKKDKIVILLLLFCFIIVCIEYRQSIGRTAPVY